MQHDVWHLVSGSLSADRRRARVACSDCGVELDRIHPFTRTVEQVPHEAGAKRRAR